MPACAIKADPGADAQVSPGATVTLEGAATGHLPGVTVKYAWAADTDSDATDAMLSATDIAGPDFTAPEAMDAQQRFTFKLTVSDEEATSGTDEASVTYTFAATGQPAIAGAPQVGEELTASIDAIEDQHGLPAFPDDFTFRWVSVDEMDSEADVGTNSHTYTPTAADVGKTIRVEVEFTDNDGNAEGPLASEATAAVVRAPEDCAADRPDHDWCALMTVGVDEQPGNVTLFGYDASGGYGALVAPTFEYGGQSFEIKFLEAQQNEQSTYYTDIVIDPSLPPGSVFDLGGARYGVNDSASSATSIGTRYRWQGRPDPAWFEGRKLTVSANLAPVVVSATVDATSLVLTYAEGLDTSSVPATGDYVVTVADTAATVSDVSVDGAKVTLTLETAVTPGQVVTVDYTAPTSGAVRDASGLDAPSLSAREITNNTGADNHDASGNPGIDGVPQAGRVLTATIGTIADTDGVATFPDEFTFRWVSVDEMDTETDVGTDSHTYTPTAADVGKTIRVEVEFDDDRGTREGPLASEAVGAVVAGAGICGAGSDWSALMTVGYMSSVSSDVLTERLGYDHPASFGGLDPRRITYDDGTSSPYTVMTLDRERKTQVAAGTVDSDVVRFIVAGTQVHGELIDGTLLHVGGTALEVGTASATSDQGREEWDIATLAPHWVGGQEMRVCANLAPGLVSATVDATSLVLTYAEDLDAGSVPEPDDYVVTVDSAPAAVSSVAIAGRKVTLTLATAVTSGQAVTVDYTAPTRGAVRDASGLDAPSFAGQAVDSDTPSTVVRNGGDLRLVDDAGNEVAAGADGLAAGRLEVWHRKQWGTVCDDHFNTRNFDVHVEGRGLVSVPNIAPTLACRLMGYEAGWVRSRSELGMPLAPADQPIWLDDVRCAEDYPRDSRPVVEGRAPPLHRHCYHAGVGNESCAHHEDVHLECAGPNPMRGPLGVEIAGLPDPVEHNGTPFTVHLSFSEPIDIEASGMRLATGIFRVDGAESHSLSLMGENVRIEEDEVVDGLTSVINHLEADRRRWVLEVEPVLGADVTISLVPDQSLACESGRNICTPDGRKLAEGASVTIASKDFLTVELEDMGTGDGKVRARFSEAVTEEFLDVAGTGILHATNADGLTVTEETSGDLTSFVIDVAVADTDAPVTVRLAANNGCGRAGAPCTPDGRPLAEPGAVTIDADRIDSRGVGPVNPNTLRAWFEDLPADHDGRLDFIFELHFSQEVYTGEEEGVRRQHEVRNALDIDGGRAVASSTIVKKRFDGFRIRVRPDGAAAVTITLEPPKGGCTPATPTCTPDNVKLGKAVTGTVAAPARISVKGDTVEEGPDAELRFRVELSRATERQVFVDYETRDGSAEAGEDYVARSGTLIFWPGETAKTVAVRVLDDAHDEPEETMTLRLSDAQGAWLEKAEATGTIENSDAMPRAWLARFGRTVGEQVLDAVEERIRAAPEAGVRVTVAGQRLGGKAPDAEAREEAEAKARRESVSAWLAGETEARERRTRTVTSRELLTGSSFALTAGSDEPGGERVSLWGRGAVTRFDGREDDVALDGEVGSALLGADFTRGRWTAGVVLSHARGEGSYQAGSRSERHGQASTGAERSQAGEADGPDGGEVASTLTGLYPWGRYALTDRVTVWGAAGYGAGTLTLTPGRGEAFETDMDLAMAAAGFRGVVIEAPAQGGPQLEVTTDALGVRTASEAVTGSAAAGGHLAAAQGDVTRLRLGLEGTWQGLALGSGTLGPRLEVGVRHDGGDAETGFGLDLGGGLSWSDPGTGLRAQASGRGLLTHESSGFGERGFAGAFGWDPRPGTDRGPSLTVRQALGVSASGGADALLGRTTLAGFAANDDGDALGRRRLEVKLGYGVGVLGDRFTAVPEAGLALSEGRREYSVGWRLARERRTGVLGSLGLSVEARRRESATVGTAPEDHVGMRLDLRW